MPVSVGTQGAYKQNVSLLRASITDVVIVAIKRVYARRNPPTK